MDRSYPYSRRLLTRARLRKRMAAVAAAGLLAATAVFMLTWKPDPISAAVPAPFMPALGLTDVFGAGEPFQRGVRRIYPYSVVPGGVSDQVELKRIIRTDSVVAAHYATFDTGKAHAVVVDKPRAVHVSYRKGDKVYWTAHKVMLAPGETLLSDGRNEMRARCANRISDLPQYPVEAHKPAMEELDQPVELAEGEEYALGPDGMPVVMGGEGGIGRHTGTRFPTRGGSAGGSTGSGSAATPADGTLASSLSSSAGSMGPVTTMGLSGSSSSLGSRPRPANRPTAPSTEPAKPAVPEPESDSGSGGSSGSSGSPTPPSGGSTPVKEPAPPSEEPVTSPVPGTTTPPGSPVPETSTPTTAPGPDPVPPPVTDAPPEPPAPPTSPPSPQPGPEPVPPKPAPQPLPPQPIEQPPPAEVPEPGSLWLFGLALAAMGVLRRRRRS